MRDRIVRARRLRGPRRARRGDGRLARGAGRPPRRPRRLHAPAHAGLPRALPRRRGQRPPVAAAGVSRCARGGGAARGRRRGVGRDRAPRGRGRRQRAGPRAGACPHPRRRHDRDAARADPVGRAPAAARGGEGTPGASHCSPASGTSERGGDSTRGTATPSERRTAPPAGRAGRGGRLRRPGAAWVRWLQARADLHLGQVRRGHVRARARQPRLAARGQREHGGRAGGDRPAGRTGRGRHGLAGDARRTREDAPSARPRRDPGPPRRAGRCRHARGARDRAVRPRLRQPLPVRGGHGAARA